METKLEKQHFADSPEALVQLCIDVISIIDNSGLKQAELAEKQNQLHEISRTIDKLERMSTAIPNELRSLKTDLVKELTAVEEKNKKLSHIAEGLDKILNDLYTKIDAPIIRRRQQKSDGEPRRRRRTNTTRGQVLQQEIIKAIKKLGGKGNKRDIIEFIGKQLEGKFLAGDLEKRPSSGEIIWINNACWERARMIESGILRKDSPHGVWELNEDYK